MTPKLFIGLVTHSASRFAASQGELGLPRLLARELEVTTHQIGFTQVKIVSENLYDSNLLLLNRAQVLDSIAAELDVETRWRLYIRPEQSQGILRIFMRLRHVYRILRYAPPWARSDDPNDKGRRMLTRLINIELAHISLLQQGLESEAEWVLILEDDASVDSVQDFAADLLRFISSTNTGDSQAQPMYVNISRSFKPSRLGITPLTTHVGHWSVGSEILASSQPVTNTVCAILYRRDFVEKVLGAFSHIPLSPVLPIDWKLNLAIMNLVSSGAMGAGDCWIVEPAPILQSSMHGGTTNKVIRS